MSAKQRLRALLTAAGVSIGVLAGAHDASATWSIVIIDMGTGEVALGSATCLVGFDLQANTPVLLTGIGGATAQSFVDSTGQNRVFIRDQLLAGTPLPQILSMLSTFDSGHQTRQYGMGDTWGPGHVATFTGTGAGQWAGGTTGLIPGGGSTGGDIIYAIQGNVLTGSPVVFAAEEAIVQTTGDVALRLMNGMEAARSLGGDGRCSCSPGNPTGCGSPPPPGFRRSAYIAYMLIARIGDRDGCNGIYRVGSGPTVVIATDVDLDGKPDLLTLNTSASTVSVSRNTTRSPSGPPTFTPTPASFGVGTSPRDVAAANMTSDNFPDVVVANFSNSNISVMRGLNGTLLPRTNYFVGAGPTALALADYNGDTFIDVAVASTTSASVTVLPNDGTATLGAPATVPGIGAGPSSIDAGDVDGDSDIDLVVGLATANAVVVLRNTTPPGGPISFTVDSPLAAGRGINGVKFAHLNADTMLDIVASSPTDNRFDIFLQTATGFTPSMVVLSPTFLGPSGVAVGDVSGDGILDLVTTTRTGTPTRLVKAVGRGDGTFEAPVGYQVNSLPGRPTLADLNGDGDLDATFATNSAIVVENMGAGLFNSGLGCATGNYFMSFNVTTNDQNAEDPVFILRELYDQWRFGLVGRPDAVLTGAVLDDASIVGNGTDTATLTITPRDWQGSATTAPISSVVVTHSPASDGLSSIGSAVNNGDGTWSVVITAGDEIGQDRFRVRIDDGIRPVVLMPEVGLSLTLDADWNGDGVITSDDFFAFMEDFVAGAADANEDGLHNSQDFFDFLNAFFAG